MNHIAGPVHRSISGHVRQIQRAGQLEFFRDLDLRTFRALGRDLQHQIGVGRNVQIAGQLQIDLAVAVEVLGTVNHLVGLVVDDLNIDLGGTGHRRHYWP